MGRARIDMHRLQEVVRLHRLGRSGRAIARVLRIGRNSLNGYLEALARAGVLAGRPDELPALDLLRAIVSEHVPSRRPPQQTSTVESWREVIAEQREGGAGPTAIHDWLRLHGEGYAGSLSAVKRLCRHLELERGPRPTDVAIPVETEPGEVAQEPLGACIYNESSWTPRKRPGSKKPRIPSCDPTWLRVFSVPASPALFPRPLARRRRLVACTGRR